MTGKAPLPKAADVVRTVGEPADRRTHLWTGELQVWVGADATYSELRATGRDLQVASLQVLLTVAALAHQAWYMADAISRANIAGSSVIE